jgi:uncharacterized protein YukE
VKTKVARSDLRTLVRVLARRISAYQQMLSELPQVARRLTKGWPPRSGTRFSGWLRRADKAFCQSSRTWFGATAVANAGLNARALRCWHFQ